MNKFTTLIITLCLGIFIRGAQQLEASHPVLQTNNQTITYIDFEGNSHQLIPISGQNVALLVPDNGYDQNILTQMVAVYDQAYDYYKQSTGKEPIPAKTYNGLTTIAVVPATCGAGCGYLGFTGIELQQTYFDSDIYPPTNLNNEYDQVVFYEFGRNFWFYADHLTYQAPDSGDITTGFAVFMRFKAMEATGVNPAPFGNTSFQAFENEVRGLLQTYLNNSAYTWETTLKVNQGVPNSLGLGTSDLFASFLFALEDTYGPSFVQQFWKEAGKRPEANLTQDAVDNFVIAASIAASENLTNLFNTTWRWPVSAQAQQELTDYFSSPPSIIYISSSTSGTVDGVTFTDEDILAFDINSATWSRHFDGSDVGLSGNPFRDVDAFTILDDGSILLSIAGASTVPDVGVVDDSDIIRFIPTKLGPKTEGTYEMYFDGSDVGLTTDKEDIDALAVLEDGRILISTLGFAQVSKQFGNTLNVLDEDLLAFTPNSLGNSTSGYFSLFVDGSDLGLNTPEEDTWGLSMDAADSFLYINPAGNFDTGPISGAPADFFSCQGVTLGSAASCASQSIFFDGSINGIGTETLDGIHVATNPNIVPVDEIVRIENEKSGKCIDSEFGAVGVGTKAIQFTCTTGLGMFWQFSSTSETGYYQLYHQKSGLCLVPENNSNSTFAELILTNCSGSDYQKWTVNEVGNNFEIKNKGSDLCVDTELGSTNNFTPLIQFTCTQGDSLQWKVNQQESYPLPFIDQFNNSNSGWQTSNVNGFYNLDYDLSSDEFFIELFGNNYEIYSINSQTADLDLIGYSAKVEARMVGSGPARYGLVFDFVDNNNYYIFSVNPISFTWQVERVVNGSKSTITSGTSIFINGGNQTNEIEVSVIQGFYEVKVNGVGLAILNGGNWNQFGKKVGLFNKEGTNPVEVRFDNFELTQN
ncbi:MAG: RICIN domain-containing protein [Chloroflexota bacterium]